MKQFEKKLVAEGYRRIWLRDLETLRESCRISGQSVFVKFLDFYFIDEMKAEKVKYKFYPPSKKLDYLLEKLKEAKEYDSL